MLMLLSSSMVLPKRVLRSLPCGRERLEEEESYILQVETARQRSRRSRRSRRSKRSRRSRRSRRSSSRRRESRGKRRGMCSRTQRRRQ